MADANAEVVRRFFEGIINEGRLELADEVLTPDYRDHAPLTAEVPGPEGFKRRMQLLASSLEMRIAIEDMTVEEDRVAFRWTMTGRHVGEFGGLAPTGRAVTLTGLNLERLRDGRIVEHWSEYDRMGLMHQVEGTDAAE
jgi:predicted ester cyclase